MDIPWRRDAARRVYDARRRASHRRYVFARVTGVFDVEVRSAAGASSELEVTCKYRGRAEISSSGPGFAPSFKRQRQRYNIIENGRRLSDPTPAGTSGES